MTQQKRSQQRGDSPDSPGARGRWSSRRKLKSVLRVLRGEDLDALLRELGVTAGAIAAWWDQVLASGRQRGAPGPLLSATR